MKRGCRVRFPRVGRQSGGLCLDGVFLSSRGRGHRGETGVDSGIRDRVDGWVTRGALGCSGGKRRWGRGGRGGGLRYLQKEKEKEESSRMEYEMKVKARNEITEVFVFARVNQPHFKKQDNKYKHV